MKKFLVAIVLVFVVGYGILLVHHSVPRENLAQVVSAGKNITTTIPDGFVPVARVIDGDTIVVVQDGREETVRLLGMDTPETVDPRKSVQCFGHEASEETKSLVEGHAVRLVPDPTQNNRDKYNRLLRYVYSDDGVFVDEFLIQQGFAREYTYKVPYQFQSQFRADQLSAQTANLGLWSSTTCNGGV